MLRRLLRWLRCAFDGRCTSHFLTAYDENLRCELPHAHTSPHRAYVRTRFSRDYAYEWSYGPRR